MSANPQYLCGWMKNTNCGTGSLTTATRSKMYAYVQSCNDRECVFVFLLLICMCSVYLNSLYIMMNSQFPNECMSHISGVLLWMQFVHYLGCTMMKLWSLFETNTNFKDLVSLSQSRQRFPCSRFISYRLRKDMKHNTEMTACMLRLVGITAIGWFMLIDVFRLKFVFYEDAKFCMQEWKGLYQKSVVSSLYNRFRTLV